MQRWSQVLIDDTGNFGWRPEPFVETDKANDEMNAMFDRLAEQRRADPDNSALSVAASGSAGRSTCR